MSTSPLHVAWDSSVSSDAIQAVNEGINILLSFIPAPIQVKMLGTGPWGSGDFGSADWYISASTLPDGRVDAGNVLSLLGAEPWQQETPHYDLLVTGHPLTGLLEGGGWLNFVFGCAHEGLAVISTDQFVRDASSPEAAYAAFRVFVAHELGHAFGIHLPPEAPNADQREGIFEGHCTNLCIMQQVMSVPEAEDLARGIEMSSLSFVCPDCQSYLQMPR